MIRLRVGASDYYDFLPEGDHRPGDIWSDVPTQGILPLSHTPALVITPACDLVNRKVETITYLPIIPVRFYFASSSYLPELLRATSGQLSAAGRPVLEFVEDPYKRPTDSEILQIESDIESALRDKGLSEKEREALTRARSGIQVLKSIYSGDSSVNGMSEVKTLLGEKQFRDVAQRVVRNALRPDVHFLPYDEQHLSWSGMPEHSLVLFRFPITAPIEIFQLAQSTRRENWETELKRTEMVYPCARSFSARFPMKRLRIKPRFLNDLLTRYTAVYTRLGSPDFSSETIARFTDEIVGTQ